MPEPLVRAMAGLAVELGWLRWVAVLLGMFFFLCRPGELLQARRRDLLTPGEALDENSGWLYLRNTKPKSRKKSAKVRHVSSLNEPTVLNFVCLVWQYLDRNELLYPGSPSAFRRRWDRLLQVLRVPPIEALTPASCRAGGAIKWYQRV